VTPKKRKRVGQEDVKDFTPIKKAKEHPEDVECGSEGDNALGATMKQEE